MKLSIIIPAHNEEHRLPPVLKSYATFFEEKMGRDVELILVANGCMDDTARIAREIAGTFLRIQVIEEPKRTGKGGAVILGIKEAVGDYIGFVDADGATAPEAFLQLYKQCKGIDGAIASRWVVGSVVHLPQKLARRISSRVFNLMTRLLFGLNFSDTQCGAKIFRKEAFQKILPELGITQWAFDVDILFHMRRNGYVVKEFSTVWNDAEGSTLNMRKAAWGMAQALVRLRLIYSPFNWVVGLYNKTFAKLNRKRGF